MNNHFIIISGPSGAGEDSVIKCLRDIIPVEVVITTVTRKMRVGEKQGSPYYFVTTEQFLKEIEAGNFFEYAKHYNGNYYGVGLNEIERIKNEEKIGIFKVDYQGVRSLKGKIPGIKAILLTAPLDALESRIRRRDHADDKYVAERMAYTKEWLKHKDIYDYEVINEEGKLDETVEKVAKIIEKELTLDKKQKI